jgi:NAD+ synthase
MLGLRDYVNKNGFPGVVIGLSGGIDSALAAVIAADALGADKVRAVMMPSPYTSQESLDDAAALAQALKCRYETIPINTAMAAFDQTLCAAFAGKAADTTEENIQARIRGMILMAISNKFGPMVLSTGNKSEMSVGYSTLYGDLCGGFAVLKDLYKTQVYKLSQWRNAHKPRGGLGPEGVIIPENIFTRPPTAELRPNQTDQDSLPPYDMLDAILECLIERDMGVRATIAAGYDAAVVRRVWAMLDKAEYKRRQAPPGVKITRRHLGKDRRYPITNRYKETS